MGAEFLARSLSLRAVASSLRSRSSTVNRKMPVERAPERNGTMPVLLEKEEIRHTEQKTKLHVGTACEGEGVLHLTNQRIVWLADAGVGCAIDYPFVSVHAVSRDTSAWPEACLYCQLRTEDKAEQDDEDGEGPEIPEFRFVPSDSSHLQRIFTVFSEMSALNPDPLDEQDDSESDSEDDIMQEMPQQGVIWNADMNDDAMEDADSEEDGVIN